MNYSGPIPEAEILDDFSDDEPEAAQEAPVAAVDDAEAQEPVPAPRDPFPTHALPEPLRSMVIHAARQTNAPEALCAAWGIGVTSASMGSAYQVQSGPGQTTRGNLYLLAFAESGTGKGQSHKVMAAPWLEEEARMIEEWIKEERPNLLADLETASTDLERAKKQRKDSKSANDSTEARLSIADATKRKDEAERALARAPLLNIGNATAEAVVEALCHAPGFASAMISSEARDIVANLLGRYSQDGKGSDEAIFLQAYSGDPVTHSRKGKNPMNCPSPCLALCLAVQPDIWDRMAADHRLMESGFLARCMAFDSHARPLRPSSHEVPVETAEHWASTVRALLDRRSDPAPRFMVHPSDGAQEVIDALAHEAADKREEGGEWKWCCSSAARLAENTWRLALVFHALKHPSDAGEHELSTETALAAKTVTRWFFGETLALLEPSRSQQKAKRMERLATIFSDRNAEAISLSKLDQRHRFTEREVRDLAQEFPNRLVVAASPTGPKGGRPGISARLIRRAS